MVEYSIRVESINDDDYTLTDPIYSSPAIGNETPYGTPDIPGITLDASNQKIHVDITNRDNKGKDITKYRYIISTSPSTWSYPEVVVSASGLTNNRFTIDTIGNDDLSNGTRYYIKVRATNDNDEIYAIYTDYTLHQNTIPYDIPAEPTQSTITFEPKDTIIDVTHKNVNIVSVNGGNTITGYRYKTTTDLNNWPSSYIEVSGNDITTTTTGSNMNNKFTIPQLTNDLDYYVKVSVRNNAGYSVDVTFGTFKPRDDPEAPDKPKFTLKGSNQSIVVTIKPLESSDGGSPITHYNYRVFDVASGVQVQSGIVLPYNPQV